MRYDWFNHPKHWTYEGWAGLAFFVLFVPLTIAANLSPRSASAPAAPQVRAPVGSAPIATIDVLRMKDKPADPVLVAKEGHLSELEQVRQSGSEHDNYRVIGLRRSCGPPAGTPVIVTNRGLFSSTILVIRGDATGCRGDVPNEWLGKEPRPY
jgi:hypothetical protein